MYLLSSTKRIAAHHRRFAAFDSQCELNRKKVSVSNKSTPGEVSRRGGTTRFFRISVPAGEKSPYRAFFAEKVCWGEGNVIPRRLRYLLHLCSRVRVPTAACRSAHPRTYEPTSSVLARHWYVCRRARAPKMASEGAGASGKGKAKAKANGKRKRDNVSTVVARFGLK